MAGNILNGASGDCSTQGFDREAMTETCAVETNTQVFESPSVSFRHYMHLKGFRQLVTFLHRLVVDLPGSPDPLEL